MGVRAQVEWQTVTVGNAPAASKPQSLSAGRWQLEAAGQDAAVRVADDEPAGRSAAADTLRPEVPAALAAARELGMQQIELLTGDNERAAAALAEQLGVDYRAESAAGRQDRHRQGVPGAGACRGHGGRRRQRCARAGAGRRRDCHGRGRNATWRSRRRTSP